MNAQSTIKLTSPFTIGLLTVTLALTTVYHTAAQTTNASAAATDRIRYDNVAGASWCEVAGTSTMHAWTMKTVQLVGHIEADPGFPESALSDATKAKPDVRIRVPLRTLKSDKEAMDKKMQEHMNIVKIPNVEFRLLELKPKSVAGAKGALQFDAVGTLAIYGATRTNTMPVTIEKKDNQLKVTGSLDIKMSDYGIPKLTFLQLASVGDDLKLKFDWTGAPKAKPQP